MALNLKLQMRLSQQLIMTPQLQQAIKLLQLSRQELEQLIDQALVENPVLEEDDEPAVAEEPSPEPAVQAEQDGDLIQDDRHQELDADWQQYMSSGSGVIPERGGRDDGDESSLEATLSRAESLPDHLLWQLKMSPLSQVEQDLGEYLIGCIDDDGYLGISLQEALEIRPRLHDAVAAAARAKRLVLPTPVHPDPALLTARYHSARAVEPPKNKKEPPEFAEDADAAAPETPVERIVVQPEAALAAEAVLRYLQCFDPPGVGARSLQECLEVQLKVMGLEDSLAFRIVHQDLKLLEHKDLRRVARRQKADLDDVVESYKLIMSLEPKPGRPFVRERAQHIIPDVFIYKMPSGGSDGEDRVGHYRVVLNESGLPRLRISEYYRALTEKSQATSGLTQEYIQEKIKAGNWLMKSIEQRQKTILRVTRSILKNQYEFFEKGIHFLKPLVLKDVAEDIEVHESTVSRITTNKYVHSPQGIFELKFFFTSGIDQGQGEVISSKKIKDMIEKMIGGEDNREPLTDIQIAERLSKDSNIKVARRTVAKYREALNLLPSNKRKQLF
jgi:RNA polymerase sigma-54 factor